VYQETVTDVDGYYDFVATAPGTYRIYEELQDGWTQVTPDEDYEKTIPPDSTTGLDFVNFHWAKIKGYKFLDADESGDKHSSEPGLEHWTISLYDSDTKIDETTTNEFGYYEFDIKFPGIYTVKETLIANWWMRTNNDYTFQTYSRGIFEYDFGNWLGKSWISDSSFCYFDKDEAPDRQFRVIFTPDVNDDPNLFKVSATNPGQFFYHVFYNGLVGSSDIFYITLPDSFETQGGNPVHVYDSLNTGVFGCLIPGDDISELFEINWEADPITISPISDYDGFMYIAVHCDYAPKQTGGHEQDLYEDIYGVWRAHASIDNVIILRDLAEHLFSVSGPVSDSQVVESRNEFKKIRGIAGLIDAVPAGFVVTISGPSIPDGSVDVYVDEDGFYGYAFHHTGKRATYTISPVSTYSPKTVQLKAGRFAEVNFP
jgi:hypothetical protein